MAGLDITFEHLSYDWNHPSRLGEILDAFPESALAAGSSEGGLFEYGSDEAILANLEMARDRSPAGFTLTGSASKRHGGDHGPVRALGRLHGR